MLRSLYSLVALPGDFFLVGLFVIPLAQFISLLIRQLPVRFRWTVFISFLFDGALISFESSTRLALLILVVFDYAGALWCEY